MLSPNEIKTLIGKLFSDWFLNDVTLPLRHKESSLERVKTASMEKECKTILRKIKQYLTHENKANAKQVINMTITLIVTLCRYKKPKLLAEKRIGPVTNEKQSS